MSDWEFRPAGDLGLPLVDRLWSLRREHGLVSAGVRLPWWGLVRCYLGIWHRLRVEGRHHLPDRPPFVLVANHTSHLDALILASSVPWRIRDRVFPVAAGDVFFDSTLTSVFAAGLLNALPLRRRNCGPHALAELRSRLIGDPCGYILFPEGTRSRDGQMSSFKPGLGMLVAGTDVPVVPCHLTGCHRAWAAGQPWPTGGQVRLRIGEPLQFHETANDRSGWQHIAVTTESRVRDLEASSPPGTWRGHRVLAGRAETSPPN